MPKICEFRSADRCGFLESNLSPCPSCPFRPLLVSLEEILVRIHGEPGPPGATGAVGREGSRGDDGAQGDMGTVGSIGERGLAGLEGAQGPRGLPGPEGDEGDKGDRGDRGDKGDDGTVDEELLKRLIKSQAGHAQPNQVLIGWGSRKGITLLDLVTKTSNYTADGADSVILCNALTGGFTITLPTAVDRSGKVYHIKKIDSSGNIVTVDGNASETIDGDTTKVIDIQYDSMMTVSDGSNWHII